jgi:hypothetical protein
MGFGAFDNPNGCTGKRSIELVEMFKPTNTIKATPFQAEPARKRHHQAYLAAGCYVHLIFTELKGDR